MLSEARKLGEAWRREYNKGRLLRAFGERMASEFAGQLGIHPELIMLQAAEDSL